MQVRDKEPGCACGRSASSTYDEEAPKNQGEVTVKIAADVQPVPPSKVEGQKLRPVEFENLTATAWIDDQGNRPKIAWSLTRRCSARPGCQARKRIGRRSAPRREGCGVMRPVEAVAVG